MYFIEFQNGQYDIIEKIRQQIAADCAGRIDDSFYSFWSADTIGIFYFSRIRNK